LRNAVAIADSGRTGGRRLHHTMYRRPAHERRDRANKFPIGYDQACSCAAPPVASIGEFLQDIALRLAGQPSNDAVVAAINLVLDRVPQKGNAL
jgi:hypothetical protein